MTQEVGNHHAVAGGGIVPNHITQHIHFLGVTPERLAEIRKLLEGPVPDEDGEIRQFNFEVIIPLPTEIDRYPPPKKGFPEEIRKQSMSDALYEWRCANWGTKWGSYDLQELPDGWKYETAWHIPEPILLQVSRMVPDLDIQVEADDEGGWFTDVLLFRAGVLISKASLKGDDSRCRAVRIDLYGEEAILEQEREHAEYAREERERAAQELEQELAKQRAWTGRPLLN